MARLSPKKIRVKAAKKAAKRVSKHASQAAAMKRGKAKTR